MSEKNSKNKKVNLHKGHRMRVKKQLLDGGFNDTTPSHVLLETLLYFSVPQKDTNPLAHALLNTFGSISSVLTAPRSELLKIEGVTDNTVALFRIMAETNRRMVLEENRGDMCFQTFDEVGAYLVKQFASLREEYVGILFLKATGKVIKFEFVGKGDLSCVGVSTRKIIELALKCDATLAVLCHNHPSGIALPSQLDIEITRGLVSTLSNVGIKLIDHVIVSEKDYVSLAQSQEFSSMF